MSVPKHSFFNSKSPQNAIFPTILPIFMTISPPKHSFFPRYPLAHRLRCAEALARQRRTAREAGLRGRAAERHEQARIELEIRIMKDGAVAKGVGAVF
jgi:hypothetical protein